MKKVLIISYHAPPRNATAAHRIEALIWNLPKFNWQPIICSGPPLNFALAKLLKLNAAQNLSAQVAQLKSLLNITSEVSTLDKLLNCYAELFFYPDPMHKWANTPSAKLDYEKYQPDLIMSHSFPHTSHMVASRLVKETHHSIPWIASFSDLWTQSHFYPYSQYRRHFESALEDRVLNAADCFVTVSPDLSYSLEKQHSKSAHTILNSYPESPDIPLTDKFTITYTGNFYPRKYDLELFAWTISMHRTRWPNLQLRFYGQPYPFLVHLTQKYNLPSCTFYGPISHHESLKAQKESRVLLQFVWNDGHQGIYSAKLFEYLGAHRPIIAFGGKDKSIGELLDKSQSGTWCKTPDDLVEVLDMLYWEYQNNSPCAVYSGNPVAVSQYSAYNMARQHAELFDRVISQ